MYNAILGCADQNDIIIKAAAVADYTPQSVADEKIKKSDDDAVIALKRTKDILKALGERKKAGQFLCGFSMETENVIENSRAKLKKKNADMICANSLREDGAGFGVDTNIITLITENGCEELGKLSKFEAANAILDRIKETLK
jgi:phosphopantothenoylcysteine decarboxylase/phosphopantothenate--cysteine ligase